MGVMHKMNLWHTWLLQVIRQVYPDQRKEIYKELKQVLGAKVLCGDAGTTFSHISVPTWYVHTIVGFL